jgi:hypothetical protein
VGEGDGEGAGLLMLSVINTMLTRKREVRAVPCPVCLASTTGTIPLNPTTTPPSPQK